MTSELGTPNQPAETSTIILNQAISAFRGVGDRPAAQSVVAALLHAEKIAKQQRQAIPVEALLGDWRLCFFTTGKAALRQQQAVGRGLYQPKLVPAQIGFGTQNGGIEPNSEIRNQIQLAGLRLRLTGPMRYLDQKNLLAFDFTHMQIALFGRSLYQGAFGKRAEPFSERSLAKLPFFTFFWASPEGIAARGRGGGLALWVRADAAPAA